MKVLIVFLMACIMVVASQNTNLDDYLLRQSKSTLDEVKRCNGNSGCINHLLRGRTIDEVKRCNGNSGCINHLLRGRTIDEVKRDGSNGNTRVINHILRVRTNDEVEERGNPQCEAYPGGGAEGCRKAYGQTWTFKPFRRECCPPGDMRGREIIEGEDAILANEETKQTEKRCKPNGIFCPIKG